MKPKQLIILLVVLVAAALVAVLVNNNRKSKLTSEMRTGQKLFPEFPINDVTTVVLESTEGAMTLNKGDAGDWTVAERENYPAANNRIARTLRNIWNTKIVSHQEIGASQHARMSLKNPSEVEEADKESAAVIMSFKGKDGKELRRLIIGKETANSPSMPSSNPMMGMGGTRSRYLMTSRSDKDLIEVKEDFDRVSGDDESWPSNFANLTPFPSDWLSKDFIKLGKVKSVAVDFQEEDKTDWMISREKDTDNFTLVGAAEDEEIDTASTGTYKTMLSSSKFKDVLLKAEADAVDMTKGVKGEVLTFDGFTYQFEFGPENTEKNTFPMRFKVGADLPKERVAEEDESEEDKKKKDEEFAEKQKALKEKLAKEKALEGHWFAMNSWDADKFFKERSSLIKKPEEKDDDSDDKDAAEGPTGRIEAVTPPVRVPPLEPAEIREKPPGVE